MVGPGERKVPAFAVKTVLFRASWSGTSALRTSGVEEGSVSQAPWEAALWGLWPGLGSPHDTFLLVGSCVPPGEGWGAAVSIRSKAHRGGLVRAQSLEQRPHTAGGHSSAPRACDHTRPGSLSVDTSQVVSGGNHNCSPPLPSLPACARGGGRGPAPRSPTPTPSGILGLMSCKMRRLQLTCTDGAHTRLPTLPPTHTRPLALPPSAPAHLFQPLGSAFSGKHPSDFQTCSWPHRGCPQTLRPHLFHPGSTGGQVGGLLSAPPLPPL